jgi:hypothetical protein
MTIAERKERERIDRENPWRPMKDARPDGTICELLFNDMVGDFPTALHYFLDADGSWYRIDPPEQVSPWPYPMNWRPAYVKMTPERRAVVKRRAQR